jgi:hypothetical protein
MGKSEKRALPSNSFATFEELLRYRKAHGLANADCAWWRDEWNTLPERAQLAILKAVSHEVHVIGLLLAEAQSETERIRLFEWGWQTRLPEVASAEFARLSDSEAVKMGGF